MRKYSISQIAEKAEVSADTIRFYEKQGLLAPPKRELNKYRKYSEKTVTRLIFIKHTQEMGFSLNEIADLLSLKEIPDSACGKVYKKFGERIEYINEKINQLEYLKRTLYHLREMCHKNTKESICPVLDSVDEG